MHAFRVRRASRSPLRACRCGVRAAAAGRKYRGVRVAAHAPSEARQLAGGRRRRRRGQREDGEEQESGAQRRAQRRGRHRCTSKLDAHTRRHTTTCVGRGHERFAREQRHASRTTARDRSSCRSRRFRRAVAARKWVTTQKVPLRWTCEKDEPQVVTRSHGTGTGSKNGRAEILERDAPQAHPVASIRARRTAGAPRSRPC